MSDPLGFPRLLSVTRHQRPPGLGEHLQLLGEVALLHRPDSSELIASVEASGLCGRGGAGFPSARKLRAVASGRRRAVVVANGAEGEPASAKDELLLAGAPHLVLDGLAVAAAAVNARDAYICVKAGSADVSQALESAIEERAAAGIDRVRAGLAEIPAGYVGGEETAIVDFLNGGPGKPTFVPPRPFERGVGGRPTLIQNVETLANLGLIARHGADWFRSVGSPEDPGSVLITVSGAVNAPGVYEIAGGTPLLKLIEAAGGPSSPLQAYLLGGYAGSWIHAETADGLRLGHSSLRNVGATLGAGVVIALPDSACGVVETARVMRYLADESAGQCGPCVHGLASIAGAFEQIGECRAHAGTRQWIERWCRDVIGRGACGHPDGAVRLGASCFAAFERELADHENGYCRSVEYGLPAILPLPSSYAWSGVPS
jgi:NADH:ubiquinone oxidoreductase subunit F (NADH-binding)